ncbi:PIR Superfamily Protein [Plasmodium ovale curtisi]|uniref:PIR Superfamily Protein n=1 Tax=Plasmodium ovale curtisi TaxID=864141 RepID=A0A1A8XF39_PLAOA|nr:PIR Superfamily Protein [Plasmodium ovale curtisi]SBT02975.1 PIR Superfamily Protein [Plasmodium ovale curtisi]
MTETIYSFVNLYNIFNSKIDEYNAGNSKKFSSICGDSHNFKNINSTCYKVLMFLNHLEGNNNPAYIVKGCRFLNYWLYNDGVLEDTNNFNAVAFYKTLERDKNHGYFYKDLCGNNIEHIDKETSVKIEKLIKLHENFNKNVIKKEPLNNECKETLEYGNLYETYMEEFCVDINNVFCFELENFKPIYESYMINKECAENVPKTLKSIQRVNIAAAFTSFGPWLLPLIRKYNRILNNLNDENNHMELRDSESHEPYMNKRAYNIAYRSTINS